MKMRMRSRRLKKETEREKKEEEEAAKRAAKAEAEEVELKGERIPTGVNGSREKCKSWRDPKAADCSGIMGMKRAALEGLGEDDDQLLKMEQNGVDNWDV